MVEQNLVGKKLGDYILREKLTSGGMAHIYLGDDEKLQRRAAIKILTSDMAGDDTILRERFEREARAVAQLEHDSIVPIYQFGEEGNLYFIAMRYIEGNDLADEMKTYKNREELMPVDRMLRILEQVAGALDHAHKRGIIHRDVKPSNVLLRRDSGEQGKDKAVLTDFGLVLWEDVDKTLGTAFGTPRYISPEQATDSQSAVPQSDVYSLAVIVYEILTGEVLFSGNTPMEVALSHITEPPKPPRQYNPEIPADAQREILKALQKDYNKRHTTAMKFIGALKETYGLNDTGTKPPAQAKAAKQDVATKPLRDEPAPPAKIESWDAPAKKEPRPVPETKIEKPEADSLPKAVPISKPNKGFTEPKVKDSSGGLPLPAIIGAVVVVAGIAIAFAMGLFNGNGGGNNVGRQPANPNMEIKYNGDFFAIINTSENATLDINGLRIRGESGTSGSNFGSTLEPGDCVFVKRGNVSAGSIPSDWNCTGTERNNISGDDLYWRAESEEDTEFDVIDSENGNTVIASCHTYGLAVGQTDEGSCVVEWNQMETNE